MKRLKISFRTLAIPEKIQKARYLVAQMSGNESFTNPSPALQEVGAAADALEQAYEKSLNGGKIEIAQLRQCESGMNDLIFLLAGYVQNASRGEPSVILSSGFDVQAEKTVAAPPPTPHNINGKMGPFDGQVSLSWDRVPGAKAYQIQVSADGINNWSYCGAAIKRQFVVDGLKSGTKTFFRVSAIGTKGQSAWSDPGVGMAM
jgi:hypothetical protein